MAKQGARAGLAHVDISTGEFRVTEVDEGEAAGILENLSAREILVATAHPLFAEAKGVQTPIEDWVFSLDYADRTLREHFDLLRWTAAGWPDEPPRYAPPEPCCITCGTRSVPRSIISTGRRTTIAPRR